MVPLGRTGRLNWTSSAYRVVNDGSGLDSPFSSAGFSWSSRFLLLGRWARLEMPGKQLRAWRGGHAPRALQRLRHLEFGGESDLPGDKWQVTLQAKDVFNTRRWSYSTKPISSFKTCETA